MIFFDRFSSSTAFSSWQPKNARQTLGNKLVCIETCNTTALRVRDSVALLDMEKFLIRPAAVSEQKDLEDLQRRASLTNVGDRDALLAHPDAIELPPEQIAAGTVFVLEQNGAIAGFAALLPRADGDAELDALFVEPTMRRCGIGRSLVEHCSEVARLQDATF